jgi:hypothetical protein
MFLVSGLIYSSQLSHGTLQYGDSSYHFESNHILIMDEFFKTIQAGSKSKALANYAGREKKFG